MPKLSRFAAGLLLCCGYIAAAGATDTLSMIEKTVTETTVDIGPKGDSIGDMLVFTNEVYDSSGAHKLGTDQGYCIRTVVGKRWDCTWTTLLKGGQIVVSGPIQDNADSTVTITGGTGKYVGAKGRLLVHQRDASSYDFKWELQ